jgi:hypothetical protein
MKIRYGLGATLALAIAGVSGSATAQDDQIPSTGVFKTTQQVYELCVSTDAAEGELCDHYIMAAHDMIKLYGDTELGGEKICLPTGTPVAEIREALIEYWESEDGGLQYSAVSTIYNALVGAYGCV